MRLKLYGLQFKQISKMNRLSLEKEFSEEEILESFRSCDDDKAPGPDGFNMKFFQDF